MQITKEEAQRLIQEVRDLQSQQLGVHTLVPLEGFLLERLEQFAKVKIPKFKVNQVVRIDSRGNPPYYRKIAEVITHVNRTDAGIEVLYNTNNTYFESEVCYRMVTGSVSLERECRELLPDEIG